MITQINMSSIFLSILLLFVIFLHVAQMRPAKEQLAFLLMQVFLLFSSSLLPWKFSCLTPFHRPIWH